MSSPSVSVVIPVYNGAATIARALESVTLQTLSDFEIIVIDDGSTDDLRGAIESCGIEVRLFSQANQGAAAARNRGALEARGQFIAFLDADDFWHSRKLELQIAAFALQPEIAYCSTAGRLWTEGTPDPRHEAFAAGQTVARYRSDFSTTFTNPYLGTPAVMMRADTFWRLGGFREDLKSAEDVDLWLRAAYRQTVAHIPADLYFVVASSGSLTATQGEQVFENNLRVIEDFCRDHPEYLREHESCVRRARAKVYENWGSGELARGNLPRAQSLLLESLRQRIAFRALYLLLKTILPGIVAAR